MPRFKQMPMDPSQVALFSSSLDDALPADSDVRPFSEVLECLDYSEFERKGSELGSPAYPPKMMVKALAYAYSIGIRSSRRIEELLKVDIRFLWLGGGLKPDHNTIARFRKDNSSELERLFRASVRICSQAGLVFMKVMAVDGTKMEAAASKRGIYNAARLARELAAVEKILQEAEETDRAEDELYGSGNGHEIPEHLRDVAARRAKFKEIAAQLNEAKAVSVVATDPDSRVIMTDGRKLPAYNVQAAVDGENQVVVAMQVTQSVTDAGRLPEMVEQSVANVGVVPDVALADSGYSSEGTFQWIGESGQRVLMKVKGHPRDKDRNDLFASRCFLAAEGRDALICPAGRELAFKGISRGESGAYRVYSALGCQSCSFHKQCARRLGSRQVCVSVVAAQRQEMLENLSSPEGRRLYALRQQIVEPVFGQIKRNRSFRRFSCWGLTGAIAESALIYLAHNVQKCAGLGATGSNSFPSLLLHLDPCKITLQWRRIYRHLTDSCRLLVPRPMPELPL